MTVTNQFITKSLMAFISRRRLKICYFIFIIPKNISPWNPGRYADHWSQSDIRNCVGADIGIGSVPALTQGRLACLEQGKNPTVVDMVLGSAVLASRTRLWSYSSALRKVGGGSVVYFGGDYGPVWFDLFVFCKIADSYNGHLHSKGKKNPGGQLPHPLRGYGVAFRAAWCCM